MNREDARGNPGREHRMGVSPQERHEMVAVAAYFRAERRGFVPGNEVQDWCEAAAIIDLMLENMDKAGVTRREYERVGLRNALRLWTG